MENFTMVTLNINNRPAEIDADPSTPVLWVLRDNLGLTGTKFGCGTGDCGACTVHVDGRPARCLIHIRSCRRYYICRSRGSP